MERASHQNTLTIGLIFNLGVIEPGSSFGRTGKSTVYNLVWLTLFALTKNSVKILAECIDISGPTCAALAHIDTFSECVDWFDISAGQPLERGYGALVVRKSLDVPTEFLDLVRQPLVA